MWREDDKITGDVAAVDSIDVDDSKQMVGMITDREIACAYG
jgi:hypothetical protein